MKKKKKIKIEWINTHITEINLNDFYYPTDNYSYIKKKIKKIYWGANTFNDNSFKISHDGFKFKYLRDVENFPSINFNNVINNEKGLYDTLNLLFTYGFVVIKDSPIDLKKNEELGEQIAYYKSSMYSSGIYKYLYTPSFKYLTDASQTQVGLPLHVDATYFDYGVGFESFHLTQSDLEGYGLSFFADGFRVMQNIKNNNKETYDYFIKNKVLMGREDNQRQYFMQLINLFKEDEQGDFKEFSYSLNHLRTNNMNYEEFLIFEKHFNVLIKEINHENNVIYVQLQPGEILLFDNKRIVHGRNGLSGKVPREIITAYYDDDAVYARFRYLSNKLKISL